MPVKEVKGRVNANDNSVTLTGADDASPGMTFLVTGRDSLRWTFTGVPAGGRMRVEFLRFEPKHPPPPPVLGQAKLLDYERNDSTANSPMVIEGGGVRDNSSEGRYFYKVFLLHPTGEPTELRCVGATWAGLEWGGGEKSGKPRG